MVRDMRPGHWEYASKFVPNAERYVPFGTKQIARQRKNLSER